MGRRGEIDPLIEDGVLRALVAVSDNKCPQSRPELNGRGRRR